MGIYSYATLLAPLNGCLLIMPIADTPRNPRSLGRNSWLRLERMGLLYCDLAVSQAFCCLPLGSAQNGEHYPTRLLTFLTISPTIHIASPTRKMRNPNMSESKSNSQSRSGVSKKRISPTPIMINVATLYRPNFLTNLFISAPSLSQVAEVSSTTITIYSRISFLHLLCICQLPHDARQHLKRAATKNAKERQSQSQSVSEGLYEVEKTGTNGA